MSQSIAYAIYAILILYKVIKCFSPPPVGRRWVGRWLYAYLLAQAPHDSTMETCADQSGGS